MLVLEDYIEMIEHLPQELRDRFTEIRELDLQVQNATDKLEEKVKDFFGGARKLRAAEREDLYDNVKKEYRKVLEDADEKVHQATQIYDLVEKYIRRLDQDLYKFKMELEADNAGITEILEKRSLELDYTGNKEAKDKDLSSASQKENRLVPATPATGIKIEKRGRKRLMIGKVKLSDSGASTPTTSYTSDHMNFTGSSLVAALNQTMQKGKGNIGMLGESFDMYCGSDSNGMSLDMDDSGSEMKRKKVDGLIKLSMNGSSESIKRNKRKSQHIKDESELETNGHDQNGNGDQPEIWPYDPSEPRYCLCNQVSYGNMVACDNPSCPLEWFHFSCVSVTQTPKGKWYCPPCSANMINMKKRGRKQLSL